MGVVGVVGVGGKLKQVKPTILWYRERATVCSVKHKKQPQCTCQDKTVVGRSLTPYAALLLCPIGAIHPVVDRHEFTWSDKCCL